MLGRVVYDTKIDQTSILLVNEFTKDPIINIDFESISIRYEKTRLKKDISFESRSFNGYYFEWRRNDKYYIEKKLFGDFDDQKANIYTIFDILNFDFISNILTQRLLEMIKNPSQSELKLGMKIDTISTKEDNNINFSFEEFNLLIHPPTFIRLWNFFLTIIESEKG